MSTTEVFVEQVLIGFLVLLIVTLPFVSGLPLAFDSLPIDIASAIGVVGVAYLLGIPFDRFADTVFSGLEQRARLAFAAKSPVPNSSDPFPENLLKIAVQQGNDGTMVQMEYLKSRVRLSRAIAAFTPGLTLSVMLATWPRPGYGWHLPPAPTSALAATFVSSGILYAVAFFSARRAAKALPHTRDRARWQRMKLPAWDDDPVPWLLIPFVAIAVVLSWVSQSVLCALVGVGGLVVTLLSAWSWQRITKTYMQLLIDVERWNRQQAVETPET